MNKNFVVLESIILLYSLYSLFILNVLDSFSYLIVILLYVSFKLLYYLYDKNCIISKLFLLVLLFYLIISSYFILEEVIYFLPLTFIQLLYSSRKDLRYLTFVILPFYFILDEYTNIIYIVILLVLYFYCISIFNLYEKIDNINRRNLLLENKERISTDQLHLYKRNTENKIYQTHLEERSYLTQKLHDELGHTLSGNIIHLEAMKMVFDKDKQKSMEILDSVIINLRNGMESIRGILKNTKPESSSININNIKLIASEVEKSSDIKVDVIYDKDISFLGIYEWKIATVNIKESLTNIMKYSKASKSKIVFEKFNKIFKITVADNGVGCSIVKKGLGLQGIDERMNNINGKYIVNGDNGFSVIMLFPITKRIGV